MLSLDFMEFSIRAVQKHFEPWKKDFIFSSKRGIILMWLCNFARVQLCNFATVQLCNYGTVQLCKSATVWLYTKKNEKFLTLIQKLMDPLPNQQIMTRSNFFLKSPSKQFSSVGQSSRSTGQNKPQHCKVTWVAVVKIYSKITNKFKSNLVNGCQV